MNGRRKKKGNNTPVKNKRASERERTTHQLRTGEGEKGKGQYTSYE
jgi:hypothetical protein